MTLKLKNVRNEEVDFRCGFWVRLIYICLVGYDIFRNDNIFNEIIANITSEYE